MLCTTCINIFDESPKRPHAVIYESYEHHQSACEIEVASEAGCYICSALWDRFTQDEKTLIRDAAAESRPTSILLLLSHYIKTIRYRIFWAISGAFLAPWVRSYTAAYNSGSYGWKANLDSGVVVFTFGSQVWKRTYFSILPCKGLSATPYASEKNNPKMYQMHCLASALISVP